MSNLFVTPLKDVGHSVVREICALKMQHWPYSMEVQLDWWRRNSDPDDLLVRLLDGAGLAAFLRLRNRYVLSAERKVDALCATEVCVATAAQGTGLGRTLMRAASDIIVREPQRIGYLLCRKEQQDFYAKCGWSQIEESFLIWAASGEEHRPAGDKLCFVLDRQRKLSGELTIVGDIF